MPQISKYDMEGNLAGKVFLNDEIFTAKINEHLVHEVVNAQLAASRSGSASTKTRSEVRGGGRKPWRQKGTGRARHGSIRSPLWVGGGVIFGPKPRSYEKNVPKKKKKQAVKAALTDKVTQESFIVIDDLSFVEPKTKKAAKQLTTVRQFMIPVISRNSPPSKIAMTEVSAMLPGTVPVIKSAAAAKSPCFAFTKGVAEVIMSKSFGLTYSVRRPVKPWPGRIHWVVMVSG